MDDLRRIVLDVLKPHEPSLLLFTQQITEAEGVEAATASLIELDKEVQNVKITAEGQDLNYDSIEEAVNDSGGTVHSIDQVTYGAYIVEDQQTLQDR